MSLENSYSFKQYQQDIQRTLPDLGSILNNSIHMSIGMITEIVEIKEQLLSCRLEIKNLDYYNLKEEIGDFFWYFSNYLTINEINIGDYDSFLNDIDQDFYKLFVTDETKLIESLLIEANKFLDIDKKAFAYKKAKNFKQIYKIAKNIAYNLIPFIVYDLIRYDEKAFNKQINSAILDLLKVNINKLKARYPDKFNHENAINRNLDKEREILEGK